MGEKNHRKRKNQRERMGRGWGGTKEKVWGGSSVVECLPHMHETLHLSHNRREKKWGGKRGGSRRRKRRGRRGGGGSRRGGEKEEKSDIAHFLCLE